VLLGAALGGAPAGASVSLERTDVPLPGAPDSVALGDLDGVHGPDIAIAFPALGSVGVMLNRGDGTFAALQQYTAGPNCAGLAVDVTLGDVTQPAPPAGGGNDTISARDGTRDTIDCGGGRDKVTADRTDKVSSNCERVTRK
jgi:hypothetical protein